MTPQPFIIERTFNAPVEKVWEAITDKEKMKQWYFDLPQFEPEVGFKFQFEGGTENKSYLHLCTVTEVVKGKKISYSWRYDGYEGDSLVTFELFAEGNQTRLRLTHEGLETFPTSNPDLAKQNFIEGWTQIIGSSLKIFVETSSINRSIEVNASPAKVWDVLTNPIHTKQWSSAFGEGVSVETDWTEGSEVLWKDQEGKIGAKGIVLKNNKNLWLKIAFYDDVNSRPPIMPGEYSESYTVSQRNGRTVLHVHAGPFSVNEGTTSTPLWDKAIIKMKELAEA